MCVVYVCTNIYVCVVHCVNDYIGQCSISMYMFICVCSVSVYRLIFGCVVYVFACFCLGV